MGDWADTEANIAFDPPDYPDDWGPEQRLAAYWHALYRTGFPARTKDWHSVHKSALRESERRVSGTP